MNTEKLYDLILSKFAPDKISFAWLIKNLCIDILASMYTYENLPDSMPAEFIEKYLIMNGSACGWRYDGKTDPLHQDKLIISVGGAAESPDVYGVGLSYKAVTENGYVKSFDRNSNECAIIYNNSLYAPDMNIINNFADIIVEMFVSLKTNVLYTRNKPVFKAGTDKERAAIIKAFNDIKNDLEPIVVTSTNIMEQIDGAPESIKVLDITDVNNADKLQYIVKSIDDTFRWFFTLYGQSVQGNGKMAQQTVKEVDGSTSLSFIYPNDRLVMRRKGFDHFNEIFGTNIKVRYSDAWLTESIKYKKEADIDDDQILQDPEPEEQTEEETVEQTEERTEETEESEGGEA